MARASTATMLPLDTFAQTLGIHPLHFNQIHVEDIAPSSQCNVAVLQYTWQDVDRVGREEIAIAIAMAEELINANLGFSPVARWYSERELYNLPLRKDVIIGQWGKFITGGTEAKELISTESITYSDQDGDGYEETATVTVNTTVSSDEVAVYYPNQGGADEWEIRPVQVSIVGGIATITFYRHQALLPVLMEVLSPVEADGMDNANFLTEVDVYRHYTNIEEQVEYFWNVSGTTQTGFIMPKNFNQSIFTTNPGLWDGDINGFRKVPFSECTLPDIASVHYYAGLHTKLSSEWARAIAFYALSFLDRPLCQCSALESMVRYWTEDLTLVQSTPSNSSSHSVTPYTQNIPLGTTRGAVTAWRLVEKYRNNQLVIA